MDEKKKKTKKKNTVICRGRKIEGRLLQFGMVFLELTCCSIIC